MVAAVSTASRADGVVVEAVSVPPALAQQGLSGEVISRDLSGRLDSMERVWGIVGSGLAPQFNITGSNDYRVEIPKSPSRPCGPTCATGWFIFTSPYLSVDVFG